MVPKEKGDWQSGRHLIQQPPNRPNTPPSAAVEKKPPRDTIENNIHGFPDTQMGEQNHGIMGLGEQYNEQKDEPRRQKRFKIEKQTRLNSFSSNPREVIIFLGRERNTWRLFY